MENRNSGQKPNDNKGEKFSKAGLGLTVREKNIARDQSRTTAGRKPPSSRKSAKN